MLPLFKALVIPVLEYCSVLTSPIRKEDINKIENVQRYYTAQIRGMEALDYWDRLKALSLYSLKRRRERYCIIYTWKIIEGLVPNLDTDRIEEQEPKTGRRGRTLKIPPLKARQGTASSLKENSVAVRGPRLFNKLPKELRNISLTTTAPTSTTTATTTTNTIATATTFTTTTLFKRKLDNFLKGVPDKPGLPGYTQFQKTKNSLMDQDREIMGRTNCPSPIKGLK